MPPLTRTPHDKTSPQQTHLACQQSPAGRQESPSGLWDVVPALYRQQDDGTLRNLLGAFEEQLHAWQQRIQRTLLLHNSQHTPPWALDLLLRTWGLDPPALLNAQQKRRLLRWIVLLHRRAGTAPGIQQAVRAITGLPTRCLPLQQGWTLDSQQALDHNAQLADTLDTSPHLYAFDIQVQGQLTQQQHQAVRRMVDALRPVHCPLRHVLQHPTPLQQEATRLLGRCALYVLRRQRTNGTWSKQTQQQTVVLAHALRDAADVLTWNSLQQGWLRARKHLPKQDNIQPGPCMHVPDKALLDRAHGLLCTRNASTPFPQRSTSSSPTLVDLHQITGKGTCADQAKDFPPSACQQEPASAPLEQQATALWTWKQAGWHDHAQALLAGLSRLPFLQGAPLDPASQQPAPLHSIALLTQALAVALKSDP